MFYSNSIKPFNYEKYGGFLFLLKSANSLKDLNRKKKECLVLHVFWQIHVF